MSTFSTSACASTVGTPPHSPRPCELLLSGCGSRCSLLVVGTKQSGCVRMADHDRNSSRILRRQLFALSGPSDLPRR